MVQDPQLEVPDLGTRIGADLLHQVAAAGPQRGQRGHLVADSVLRLGQLGPTVLPERFGRGHRSRQRGGAIDVACIEQRVDQQLLAAPGQLADPGVFGLGRRPVGELLVRRPRPAAQRVVEKVDGAVGLFERNELTGPNERLFEAVDVRHDAGESR